MRYKKLMLVLSALFVFLSSAAGGPALAAPRPEGSPPGPQAPAANTIYLPLLAQPKNVTPPAPQPPPVRTGIAPRVNLPHFDGSVSFTEAAVFWLGRITPNENYADVRIGYTDEEISVHVAAFDRYLWYDLEPDQSQLQQWDSVTIYLKLDGNTGTAVDAQSYRFSAMLNWWEPDRSSFQLAERGGGSGWAQADVPFTSGATWRGNAPNDDTMDDRGWTAEFHIPFSSLGLAGAPPEGSVWGLGMRLHDRDSEAGPALADQVWPASMSAGRPGAWGQMAFGLPAYTPPGGAPAGSVTLRNGLNGVKLVDGEVGGGTVCGNGIEDWWSQWGETSTPGSEENADFNIQNQLDVADWPCFSKYYLTIPLESIPAGKSIQSATLTLHQFGNSGGGDWGQPPPSLIQVSTVNQDWDEATLTWNNAPLALENVSQAWVDPLASFPDWPGVPRTWDLSLGVAQAYAAGQPLRLVFYSADGAYHSGKYFITSDAAEWNSLARPTLEVVWGNP